METFTYPYSHGYICTWRTYVRPDYYTHSWTLSAARIPPKFAPEAQCLGQLTGLNRYSPILLDDSLISLGAALALVALVDAMAVGRESRHDADKATIEVEALVVDADAVATVVGSEVRHDAEKKMQPMMKLISFMV